MKKILLAIGTLFVLTTTGFANHSFAFTDKAILSIITDKYNQDWCEFPFESLQRDKILDEHKKLANINRNTYKPILCSEYGINQTDPKIREWYKISHPTGGAILNGRRICINEGNEVECSENTDSNNINSNENRAGFEKGQIEHSNQIDAGSKISDGCRLDGILVSCKTGEPISSITNSGSSLGECKVNGKPVDCEEMMQDVGGFLKAGLWIMLGFGALSLVGFVFWLVMLIHACSNDIPNKVLWIVLLFLFGIIAAIVYYFAVKRHCTTNYIPPANTQPYQASVTVGYHEGPVATTPFVAPVAPVPPATPPVNPITPIITTPVPTVPPTTPPSPTIPTPAQTVESMIATSGAGTMSQVPLGSSSSVTPTVPPPDQNNTPLQNPPSTGV